MQNQTQRPMMKGLDYMNSQNGPVQGGGGFGVNLSAGMQPALNMLMMEQVQKQQAAQKQQAMADALMGRMG